jgi:hypothetical protein
MDYPLSAQFWKQTCSRSMNIHGLHQDLESLQQITSKICDDDAGSVY